ncbi:MAG: hypothetical protein H0W08_24950 [Acidobacteria bacterium]|nr:hypothetical protein [Acidobacteriota bacterium]
MIAAFQALIVATLLASASQQDVAPIAPPDRAAIAQSAQPSSAAPPVVSQENGSIELPVSLERIQEALSRPPAIKPSTNRPVFRVEVFARKPTVEDILGPDYLRGPVPAGGMSHREFLNMVTPVEYRGMSIFTSKEALMVAATSLAMQWALMKAIDKLKDASNERAKDAARQEVIAAMNELEAARKKAGLPPK